MSARGAGMESRQKISENVIF